MIKAGGTYILSPKNNGAKDIKKYCAYEDKEDEFGTFRVFSIIHVDTRNDKVFKNFYTVNVYGGIELGLDVGDEITVEEINKVTRYAMVTTVGIIPKQKLGY